MGRAFESRRDHKVPLENQAKNTKTSVIAGFLFTSVYTNLHAVNNFFSTICLITCLTLSLLGNFFKPPIMASLKYYQHKETNGKTLILITFTFNHERLRLSTGLSVPVKAWDKEEQRASAENRPGGKRNV